MLLGLLGAGAFAVWWLAESRRGRASASPTAAYSARAARAARAASAILSLVLIVAAAYAAHGLGIFSLPLVVLAFVPFGVFVRWLLASTRDSRRAGYRAGQTPDAGRRGRFVLPLMAVIAVAAAVLGVIVGNIVGAN